MFRYFFKQRFHAVLYTVASVSAYITLTIVFYIYSWITDVALKQNLSEAYNVTVLSAAVLTALFLFMTVFSMLKRRVLFNIMKDLRNDVFSKIYNKTIQDYASEPTGTYMSVLINDLDTLESGYFDMCLELFGDAIQLFIMTAAVFNVGLSYGIIIILFTLPSIIQPFLLKGALSVIGLKLSNWLGVYTDKVNDFLNSIEVIKAFNKESYFKQIFGKHTEDLTSVKEKFMRIRLVNACLQLVCIYFLKIGVQLFFMRQAIGGFITVATVSMLFGLSNNIGNPISSILTYISEINGTKGVRKKIDNLLNQSVSESTNYFVEPYNNQVSIQNLYLSHGNRQLFRGLNVNFEKGKKYAIVGESGCGKSTLLKLLMGYSLNYEGSIKINGAEVSETPPESIWEFIAYMNQDTFVMQGKLRDNITLMKTYSDDKILKAAYMSGMKGMIESLPNGLDSIITEDGKNFSGGEKQRIAIARAILSGKEIILIDEGASALDNKLAEDVEKTLLSLPDKTVISVIHRMNDSILLYDAIYEITLGIIVRKSELVYS